mmetsp:Transcript_96335/g.166089  ORF Transcript_96335/g.166089 Transcript_96335/m.166089 type:complete len:119 (+) Transcript_96335:72-428(+)
MELLMANFTARQFRDWDRTGNLWVKDQALRHQALSPPHRAGRPRPQVLRQVSRQVPRPVPHRKRSLRERVQVEEEWSTTLQGFRSGVAPTSDLWKPVWSANSGSSTSPKLLKAVLQTR